MATLLTANLYLSLRINCTKKESNKNFWTQTTFSCKPQLTTYGKIRKIL